MTRTGAITERREQRLAPLWRRCSRRFRSVTSSADRKIARGSHVCVCVCVCARARARALGSRKDLCAHREDALVSLAASRPSSPSSLAVPRPFQPLRARGEAGHVARVVSDRERLDAARRELFIRTAEPAGEGGVVFDEPPLVEVHDTQDCRRRVEHPPGSRAEHVLLLLGPGLLHRGRPLLMAAPSRPGRRTLGPEPTHDTYGARAAKSKTGRRRAAAAARRGAVACLPTRACDDRGARHERGLPG